MNESITGTTSHFTSCASLAALGVKVRQMDLFGPIREHVKIAQKTVKYTPVDKLSDAFLTILAGAQGLVEINTRVRSDPGLQAAFGRRGCAEQSVVQETLDACTTENVWQMQQALDLIYRQHSQGFAHDYGREWQILDVDMSGMPCGPKAAFATKGYFAKQRNRRGRQLGRVLATCYDEVVVDRLFDGKTQLTTALQPLVKAAETTLELDAAKRARTLLRLDAGGGSLADINWLLLRGYQVHGKDYSGSHARRLAKSVDFWFDDPQWPDRQVGWVREAPQEYLRPVVRLAVRCRRHNGTFAIGVLISTLSACDVLSLVGRPLVDMTDPQALLLAYLAFYDRRGGGVETSFKGDKQGLGLTKRSKKRFEAQHMLSLLGSLAHNVVVWSRSWLAASAPPLRHAGMVRLVRDIFHISGFLLLDVSGRVIQIVLNQQAPFARFCVLSLGELLAPMHIAVTLGET